MSGATHGSDIPYLFGSPNLFDIGPKSRRDKSQDNKAVEILGKLWTNFAKYGFVLHI